ncbi:PhnB protein [Nitrosospira sp. Nsp5]|uniref:PhnB protein n=1 Tax=Nitrosospira multiformis TaxID=1231 RepID=A0ABY0TE35_9PROT|nr:MULTISPECIES: VOC family protein [Nitrosospira]PTR07999.1 PhnB protein [Nitrosospira sp. Nsp5]SDQ46366.1 PhnB protein [Nitrosospira multiformis]
MATKIKPIPNGYHTLTAYLTVRGASDAIEFYKKAFGATELFRLNMPDGKIAHGEFKIGDSIFMISDENPECASTCPETLGGSPVTLHLYVTDADATFSDAIKAGAKETMPLANQFWGDRMGKLADPFGHQWLIATHIEAVDPSELQSRMEAHCTAHKA